MLDVFNDGWIESASGTVHVMRAPPGPCPSIAAVLRGDGKKGVLGAEVELSQRRIVGA